ncbi:MAG TPA: YncE family protein [Gemmatimonadales bacterium]|nr:YncE family protein [Gemmatimonadales bacterium]
MNRITLGALLAAALATPAWQPAPPEAGAAPVLTTVADVPLPGPAVRFDDQSLDLRSDRLYIAHMGADQIVVFNVKSRRVEGTIDGVPGVTGVWAVPDLGRVYASVSRLHHVAVIDARSLRVVARVGDVGFPDGIAYAPDQGKVYVSDAAGGGELVIDARASRVAGTIPLGGEAGNTVYDPGSRCILVAAQTRNQLWVIDPAGDRVLGRFDLQGGARPHGMVIDAARRLAFVANEGDATLLTVNLRNMKVVGQASVGQGPDVLALDPGWGRLYVASEIGTVAVFSEAGGGLVREGEIHIPNAHSVAVDPRTHLVYLPLENVGGRPLLRIMAGTPPAR